MGSTTISSRFLTMLLLLNSEIIRESFLGSKFFGSSVPARNATKDKTLCNGTTAETTGTMNTPRELYEPEARDLPAFGMAYTG